jgi:hypothetical protein
MEITTFGEYRTRDGRLATITRLDRSSKNEFVWEGNIKGVTDDGSRWTGDGSYLLGVKLPEDIVAPWRDEVARIINGPGDYRARGGHKITITLVSAAYRGCNGFSYMSNGVVFSDQIHTDDIVAKWGHSTDTPIITEVINKPRKEDNMYSNFKHWLDKHSEVIFTLIGAYLIDRIMFGGEFSDRLKSMFDKGLKKQETKLLEDK